MRFNLHFAGRVVVFSVWLAVFFVASHRSTCGPRSPLTETKLAATMVMLTAPNGSGEVVLKTWDKPDPVHTMLVAESMIRGKCIHCNMTIAFTAAQASVRCGVCPCGASFAACLTGKADKKVTWRDMLDALPQGTGLRIEFFNPDKPDAGVKLFAVDLRSVLLPLSKPLELSDADFLSIIKQIGVSAVERADGGQLLRLTLRNDWTTDKERRMVKILADRGIVVNFSAVSAAAS